MAAHSKGAPGTISVMKHKYLIRAERCENMEQFFKDLGIKIEAAIKKEMPKILNKTGGEKIYTAALVTDSDCITLYLALNTCEYLKKTDEQDAARNDLPEGCAEKIRDGSGSLTKWIPDEWGYSDGKESELNQISELLYEYDENLDSDDEVRSKYGELFFETVMQAFQNLIKAKAFGADTDEITYFISMSDDDRTPAIENYSAKLLNPEPIYKEFLRRNEFFEEFFGENSSEEGTSEGDDLDEDSSDENFSHMASGEIPEDFSWKALMDDYFGIC